MQERRNSKRFDLPLPVVIEYDVNGELQVEEIQLENIGIGGAFFRMDGSITTGSVLNMHLVDRNIKFAEKLGIADGIRVPFRYLVDCEVLRTMDTPDNNNLTAVAVKFAGPVRILRGFPLDECPKTGTQI